MDKADGVGKILVSLPDSPGVYLFYNSQKELVYVGKATSLRSRVRSYFRLSFRPQRQRNEVEKSPYHGERDSSTTARASAQNDSAVVSRPIEGMIHEVVDIKWKETESALEAIILEAEYIKKFQPKYNVDGKDDKSWNYILVSKDEYPKVLTMREREYSVIARSAATSQSPELNKFLQQGDHDARLKLARDDAFAYVFGPYPGLNTKAAMKLLRRMFRFSNCVPGSRVCLYRQMGWCPGVCTGEISSAEYRRQIIRPLVTFLSGRKKQVIKIFEMEMKRAGKDERFEDAARLRDQLHSLRRIQDIALLNKSFVDTATATPPRPLLERGGGGVSPSAREGARGERKLRIEGYDISNLGASEKVGSMVVFNEEGPVKSEYRKFIIKTVFGQSDVDSLAEVLERRFKHAEWQFPNVILIDGGRPQVSRARNFVETHSNASVRRIPIVGIAKGRERKRNDIILGDKSPEFIAWVTRHQRLLIQVRDEAHRFAITFHRKRRTRQIVPRRAVSH
ncbi:MAG: hypothetical protein EXS55_00250 [Candidatus Magasanikbacteria bacterium]|nr:hypothetical protein [Candidatus Magasanikbacteria bacterium]